LQKKKIICFINFFNIYETKRLQQTLSTMSSTALTTNTASLPQIPASSSWSEDAKEASDPLTSHPSDPLNSHHGNHDFEEESRSQTSLQDSQMDLERWKQRCASQQSKNDNWFKWYSKSLIPFKAAVEGLIALKPELRTNPAFQLPPPPFIKTQHQQHQRPFAVPQPTAFGAQPTAFGAQPTAFSAQPTAFAQPTGFGAQPTAFGAQPTAFAQPTGFGAQPTAFGTQPTAFGTQPTGFGAPRQNDGFNASSPPPCKFGSKCKRPGCYFRH
jgi:hypothetical protein